MSKVHVATGNAYDVAIGRGLLDTAGDWLASLTPSRLAALIADDTVDTLYGDRVSAALRSAGFAVLRFTFPHGEANKTLATYGRMLQFLSENRVTRADTVVALGGGVTGDMAGFAAATYLRGVHVAQIPTTLLAMVDSSVGGKTGVDLPAGKNLVGAFHQPVGVLCDVSTLATLPPDVFADGMAEAIKYGILCDAPLFETLKTGIEAQALETVVERCVAIKAGVCAGDECDRGQRQMLNLGHTFGHAIERCSGYTLPHGHAVAVGMVYASRIAAHLGLCDAGIVPQVMAALTANSLPVSAPYTPDALADAALGDKKRAGGTLTLVLPKAIGQCMLHPVPITDLPLLAQVALG
jgi:3-dehydroquinate synthase